MPALHLVFDLDDTLYPEREFAVGGFKAAAAWAQSKLGVNVSVERMVTLLDDGHLGKLFGIVLEDAMPDHSDDDLKQMLRAYGAQTPSIALFADAADALAHWQRRGPLGLITDGHAKTQQSKVGALALSDTFAHIVYTGSLGADRAFHKPHPRAFELMETALGAAGDRLVYVGDNLAKDFVAPNALGWRTVLVDRPHHRDFRIHKSAVAPAGGDPHHVIADLGELVRVLD